MDDPDRTLATLASRKPQIALGPRDVYVLALVHLRGLREGLTAFEEEQLFDAIEHTAEAFGDEDPRAARSRGSHALRRLRDQNMLVRVDRAGMARPGQYALTRLAAGIAEFFIEDDVLTRENLGLLLRAVNDALDGVLVRAAAASTEVQWKRGVEAPLRVTVSDLVRGIERRQRGLDIRQDEFQQRVAELLRADWFGAIEQCEHLLDTSAATLRELHEIMLAQTHPLQHRLLDLRALAQVEAAESVRPMIDRLLDQIDRVVAWSAARQRSWSEYYEYVHGYLRDVVRLDPSRALAQRLREQLVRQRERPLALVVAAAAPMHELRDVEPREPPPAVRRPKAERDKPVREHEPQPDPMDELEHAVQAQLAAGVTDLAEVTATLTAEADDDERFLIAGRVAQLFTKLARPRRSHERPWVRIAPALAIEQLEREPTP